MNKWICFAIGAAVSVSSPAQASDWKILSVNGVAAIGEARISLNEDGTINGKTGCNGFVGAGRFENAMLVVDAPLAVTRMACAGDGLAEQETNILTLLQGATAFSHDPFTGDFALSRDGVTLELAPATASVFEAGYVNVHGLSGPLNIRSGPSTGADVVTRVLPGTLLRNIECQTGAEYDWCSIQFLDSSGTTGWAAADYLQAAPATVRAQKGLFDNIGTLPCQIAAAADVDICDYGIARDGGGTAVMVIYRPDGSERVLHFAEGDLVFAEVQSDQDAGVIDSRVQNDMIAVTLADEYFEVPQRLLLGAPEN